MRIFIDNLLFTEYNYIIWMVISFFLSATISFYSYPIIIKISKIKELMHEPRERCSHILKTPNLGGIGIFLGVISVLTFIGSILSYNNLLCLIGALVILFFVGIKDDLIEISPLRKLSGQVIASLCVIIISDIRIDTLFGFLNFETIPYTLSVVITLFVFILIINSFNLIDGVDGLAGSIGIVSSFLFGSFFYFNGNDSLLFIALSLIGSLATFLLFNFSKNKKIFMGDTGSMIIGFLLAYMSINFLHVNHNVDFFSSISKPSLLLAILCYPLMDTLRVFVIRLSKGKSPFSADNNHIHHNLLALGLKHWEISLIASIFVLTITKFTYSITKINMHLSVLLLIIFCIIGATLPYFILKLRKYWNQNMSTKTLTNNKKVFISESFKE